MKWWVVLIVVWAVVNAAYLAYCGLKARMRKGMHYNEWTGEWEKDDE